LHAGPDAERLPVVLLELRGGLGWEDLVVGLAVQVGPRNLEGGRGGVVGLDVAPL
jgi:hypothetical protein